MMLFNGTQKLIFYIFKFENNLNRVYSQFRIFWSNKGRRIKKTRLPYGSFYPKAVSTQDALKQGDEAAGYNQTKNFCDRST
jgi:hypothetical protein